MIHGFAASPEPHRAVSLFEQLSDGFGSSVDTLPGPCCFGGLILALIQMKKWDQALHFFDVMRQTGVEALPVTYRGLLLACHGSGGALRVKEFIEGCIIPSETTMSLESYLLAAKLMIPELARAVKRETRRVQYQKESLPTNPFENMLKACRKLGEENADQREFFIDLSRFLRTAEQDQLHEPSDALPQASLEKRRRESLMQLLQHMLQYDETKSKNVAGSGITTIAPGTVDDEERTQRYGDDDELN